MLNYGLGDYVQFILSGLSTGSIYVLVALGIVLIYNVTGIVNLAQGEYAMLGAMLAVTYMQLAVPAPAGFPGFCAECGRDRRSDRAFDGQSSPISPLRHPDHHYCRSQSSPSGASLCCYGAARPVLVARVHERRTSGYPGGQC